MASSMSKYLLGTVTTFGKRKKYIKTEIFIQFSCLVIHFGNKEIPITSKNHRVSRPCRWKNHCEILFEILFSTLLHNHRRVSLGTIRTKGESRPSVTSLSLTYLNTNYMESYCFIERKKWSWDFRARWCSEMNGRYLFQKQNYIPNFCNKQKGVDWDSWRILL